ncbi:M24 family metallopeptidase [Mesorhizobium captivum]|uniref:M24 family metallopeptidase n=1 Tax=Mesorhizobium captivum TaxID=3072319 RepID=UPI002A2422E3|nr:Xaa-Pro peptidase family protein [Mesorhizobium sp. VK23E]MDX8514637.1 Xaa-Pro peptidase family protein [Mesorhizobium sp. VK23E]
MTTKHETRLGTERDLLHLFRERTSELQRRLRDEGIDLLIITNVDSIYYYSAYWGDLGLEFGRPTLLVVAGDGDVTLITPKAESLMAEEMTWIQDMGYYSDGVGEEWREPLRKVISRRKARARVAVEKDDIPAVVSDFLFEELGSRSWVDGAHIIAKMRVIKSAEELRMIRQAGQVAVAMGIGGRDAIGVGVPEYEVSLACMAAGTRKAAEIIGEQDPSALMSPMIHNLQALQSGLFTSYTHLHPRVKKIADGEPVYMCFCSICHFKQLKLGYDREYFVRSVDDETARVYNTAIEAQAASFREMRPGVTAEDVHRAADEVYQSAGFAPSYRTGRALGYSSLEQPQLKYGDKTPLKAGMVFAVDGGVTIPKVFGARVGDTVIVTNDGIEIVTEFPRDLTIL